MNQSEFAKLHGVSRAAVNKWKSRGWLVFDGDEVNVELSNANINRYKKTVNRSNKSGVEVDTQVDKSVNTQVNTKVNNKVNKQETPSQVAERLVKENGATLSLDEARTLKENYLALLAKLEYEMKSGQVLPWSIMILEVGKEYARIRTRLMAIAPEHGPRLRQLALSSDDDLSFVSSLTEIIYEAMEELSIDRTGEPRLR